jgi:tetratricopeptide (TPR) repeat protein
MGETASISDRVAITEHELRELAAREAGWRAHPDLHSAMEFVAAANVTLDAARARDAAAFIVQSANPRPALLELAQRNLGSGEDLEVPIPDQMELEVTRGHGMAGVLKRRLRSDPRNALAWSDLALEYAVLGQRQQAEAAMRVALALAPQHRLILRSAARLYVHIDDLERAHRLLIRPALTRRDPWLMAAEIAIADLSGRPPRSVRAARSAIEDAAYQPRSVTELASALATLEFQEGRSKQARRLFGVALTHPTENSLAQAEWASRRLGGLPVQDQVRADQGAFEARARLAYEERDWQAAVREAWGWLMDQPFSMEPAAFGSCVAEMGLRDLNLSVQFAAVGRRANPQDPTLINNLAYAQVEQGEIDAAAATLRLIPAPPLADAAGVSWRATEGLLAYRRGDRLVGRQRYREAIAAAKSLNLHERRAMASLMLAREEWRLDGAAAAPYLQEGVQLARGQADSLLGLCRDLALAEAGRRRAGQDGG